MKWMGTLKRICKRPRTGSRDSSIVEQLMIDKVEEKKRIAWQWMLISFILTMTTVPFIFEIPFMIFDPSAFRKPNVTSVGNSSSNSTSVGILSSNLTDAGNFQTNVTGYETSSVSVFAKTYSIVSDQSSTTSRPVIMNRTMKNDLELITDASQGRFSHINRMKFFFLSGICVGLFMMWPLAQGLGRNLAFKVLARFLIIFGILFTISRAVWTTGTCWFVIGACCLTIYFLILLNLIEKFAQIYERFAKSEETGNQQSRYDKYKYRLYLGLGYTCTWNFSRLYSLLVAWSTKDWTLIGMWLIVVFAVIYFIFGDFFTDNFEQTPIEERSDQSSIDTVENEEDIDKESFFEALRTHPILCLNIFIISFNWFVCCHNLYGLVLGFEKLSPHGNMFDNIAVASGFSFLALPLKFGVCIAAQRKLLPYGLLQLFAGITILLMLAFTNENVAVGVGTTEKLTSGKIYSAHIANVFISASLGLLTMLTIESFPKKFRLQCYAICMIVGRLGTVLGIVISDLGLFKFASGPAIAGVMSITAAILSRLLPDMTLSRLPLTQAEIEREQFPRRLNEQSNAVAGPTTSTPRGSSSTTLSSTTTLGSTTTLPATTTTTTLPQNGVSPV